MKPSTVGEAVLPSNSSRAIYLQIADSIEDAILEGVLTEGERLPSVREYAATHEVNVNTVMRSYDLLSDMGLISNRRGIGYFVNEGAVEAVSHRRRETFFGTESVEMFRHLRQLGITPMQLHDHYKQYLDQQ